MKVPVVPLFLSLFFLSLPAFGVSTSPDFLYFNVGSGWVFSWEIDFDERLEAATEEEEMCWDEESMLWCEYDGEGITHLATLHDVSSQSIVNFYVESGGKCFYLRLTEMYEQPLEHNWFDCEFLLNEYNELTPNAESRRT